MSLIARWWRVVPRNGQPSVWLQQEPTPDMLTAAWEGSTVEGPFVPEATEGAVAALEFARDFKPVSYSSEKDALRRYHDEVRERATNALDRLGGQ